ncbi:MAG TPA: 50S ribosomal protein L24 [Nitrososphaerales archaeon]|nr:50S ribosomal protein L24 [Nitrososphaerales archaeon]
MNSVKFGSQLSAELRERHRRRSVRPRVGDTVRIVRGEFKDIEGKITRVDSRRGAVMVEGVTREKIKGGTSPVPISSSKVVITGLTLEDKIRKGKLEVTE